MTTQLVQLLLMLVLQQYSHRGGYGSPNDVQCCTIHSWWGSCCYVGLHINYGIIAVSNIGTINIYQCKI